MTQTMYMLPVGTMLRGNEHDYLIEDILGSGTFGITYLASYCDYGGLTVYVAIKEFFMSEISGRYGSVVTTPSKQGIFSDYQRKFAREAKSLFGLNHRGIIKVIEYFECNNTSYYSMEYLDGGSIFQYINNYGGMPQAQVLDYADQIADALSYLHANNMLHLDLKPNNIMLRDDGTPVLIDFGLAKQYGFDGQPEESTSVGAGTRGYAPIEQLAFRDGHGFPVTMDVYAFGATLFKMLTSETPPDASELLNSGFPYELFRRYRVDEGLVAVIAKAMAPIQANRYQSVDAMRMALRSLWRQDRPLEHTEPERDGPNRRQIPSDNDLSSAEQRRFSWGALAFGWIWGVANGVPQFLHELWTILAYIIFLAAFPVGCILLPLVQLGLRIYFGSVGTRLAWAQSRRHKSAAAFKETQKTWDIIGIVFFCIGVVFSLVSFCILCYEMF